MKTRKKVILTIGLAALLKSTCVSAIDYVWDAGGTTNLYTSTANWDPTAGTGGPGYGDTGVVGGSYTAAVSTAATLQRGQTLIFSNSATLLRNTSSGANYAGTLTFTDSSKMIASQLSLYSNAVFNWHSDSVWNGNGANAQANLYVAVANGHSGSGPVINMSAGTWNLTGNSGVNSFQLDIGTFTMTGGKVFAEDIFKMGSGTSSSRVNLGGTGEIYCMAADSSIQILSSSILNFDGMASALYVNTNYNIKSLLTSKAGTGNVYADGVQITSIDQLSFSNVNVDGTDYTKVCQSANEPVTNYTWDAGGTTNLYSNVANWDPTGPTGGPGIGDTGTVTGSYVVGIAFQHEMNRGATIIMKDQSRISRNGISAMNFSGTLTFDDGSQLVASQFKLATNATLNWNSTNTFTSAGTTAQANFTVDGADDNESTTVNMSAGIWLLTGNTAQDSFRLDVGTFNMTGGKIIADHRFKIGTGASAATFNLGGTGEVYAGTLGVYSTSVLNFQGTNFALYLTGFDSQNTINTLIASGNIYKNGEQLTTSTNHLQFSNVTVDGVDYTRISETAGDSYVLTGVAGSHGTVSPTNSVVPPGGSAEFTVTAENYYRIASLTTNGTPVTGMLFDNSSTSTNFIWSNVQSSGELIATFTAQVAADPAGTPYAWLAQYGLPEGEDTFEQAALADPDMDGLPTWQEYIAGTDPTDSASCLRVTENPRNVISWGSVPGRMYSIYVSTNLLSGFENLASSLVWPQNSYTNITPAPQACYQIRVQLEQ